MTVAADADAFLRHVAIERGLSANTVAAYRRDLTVYTVWLAEEGVGDVREVLPATVSTYLAHLASREESPLTATSLARMLSTVRGFHRFLLEEGRVQVDAARDIRPPKQPSTLPKAISVDQVAALLAATDGDELDHLRDKALLELMYATGARVSEAVGLNVDDVIDTDVVRLTGKGAKQRIVPLGSYAQAAVAAYLVRARPVLSARGGRRPRCSWGCAAHACPGRTSG
ncbi:site-specific integrase [Streptomyces sp. L7]|uniref:site-specific integrase n=1 Tax=Streptomyces sp. L7 TaxID=3423954 RepID=UPI003D97A87A